MPNERAEPALTIRAARPSDAEAITALVNLPGYRWGTLRLPFQTLEETNRRWSGGVKNITGLVAEQNGEIIGDLGLTRYQGRRAHVGSIGMGVHDDFTGQGIGSALLAAALDLAENWMALTRIELTVYTDNLPALALYRKFGFELEGTMRKFAYRNGEYVDCFMMARLR